MRNHLVTAAAIVAIALVAPRSARAQDDHPKPDDHRPDPAHHDDQAARHDDHPDNHGDDMVARYRHDHPGSTAHCHDGFFTRTADRRLACSKHGGIDVWIAP
jgi:hypothetical protein